MKSKTFPVLVALAVLLSAALSAQEVNSNQWMLYESISLTDRLLYLKAQKPTDLTEAFLLQALQLADSEGIEKGTDNEKAAKSSLAQWLCQTLGNRKVASAAGVLARIPQQYKDVYLRGEAWLALARLGDSRSVAEMIRELGTLNTGANRGRPQEVTAAYLIQALTLLKSSDAFRNVAMASLEWYSPSSGVHELAKKALPALAADPFAAKLELLRNDDDLIFREELFQSLAVETDPVAGGRAAEATLSTLVTFQMRDSVEKDAAVRLLKAALLAADAAPQPPAGLSAPLKSLIEQKKTDLVLKLIGVRVLARIADTASIDILVKFLGDFNMRQKQGTIAPDEVTLVREIIVNLGQTRKSTARAVLQDVRFSDYTPAIVNLALEAIDKLDP